MVMLHTPPTDADLGPGEYVLDGLAGEVEIKIDRWGIPHIYAQSRLDAFLAQGFQAARDRLFQIDLWRRRGLGRLAEVLGSDYVEQDRATRLFLYRGDLRSEWLSYNTNAKDIIGAFVAGVNAYVAWAMQAPEERLPPEFAVLGYVPARWEPEDVVRIRTHGLLYNVEQELARALTLRDLGPDAEELRSVREPAGPLTIPVPGLYDFLTDGVLDVYRKAFAPVDFGAATSAEITTPSGSNNWVISGERSASGRPVLANDPHRAVTLPSLRYLTHLEAPGLSVIGAGEPNLPGISIGHNADLAFGLTIWPVDHEDMYIYELHPEDDDRYLYRGAWEAFRVVEESSPVADAESVTHELRFSRHGPIVYIDRDARRAVGIRAAWLEAGMAPYLGSLEYLGATSTAEFRSALRRWGGPGVNMVLASAEGDIGWQASALVPRRRGWDGSLPVPGDGSHEWDGFASVEELPSVFNPEAGWFATSNQNNVPAEHDSIALPTTTDWYSGARHERLTAWFESGEALDVASSIAMQTNDDNVHGRRILDLLDAVTVSPDLSKFWDELRTWDGAENADLRAPLVFQVWQRRHLRPWLVDTCLARLGMAPDAVAANRGRLLRADTLFSDLRPDLRMLESFDLTDPADISLLTAGVQTSLQSALAELDTLVGSDRSAWTWGALHRTELRHPVLSRAKDVPPEWGALAPVPRSGSGDTVGLTGYDAEFNAVMGSSFRMAIDVGEWDESLVVNSPGQSGDPRSAHYADLLPLWAEGRAFPLAYSRDAVDAACTETILLRPDGLTTGAAS